MAKLFTQTAPLPPSASGVGHSRSDTMRSLGTFSFNFLTMQMQTPTIPATTPVSPMQRVSTLSGAGVAALTQSLSRPPSGLRRALSDAPHRPPPPEPDVEAGARRARARLGIPPSR